MLQQGSRGEEVEALQKKLMKVGIDPGPIDGVFGPKTEAAVRAFQEKFELQVDGIAGPETMGKLEKRVQKAKAAKKTEKATKAAKKAKKAEKAAPTPTPPSAARPAAVADAPKMEDLMETPSPYAPPTGGTPDRS